MSDGGPAPRRAFFTPGAGPQALAPVALEGPGELVICVDTMVDGVHFDPRTSAACLGYKALAVNLSDIAAMGARPLAYSAVVCAPPSQVAGDWLDELCDGLSELAAAHRLIWRGGTVATGPIAITVEVVGTLARPALTRAGAQPGDLVVVSGTLGDAGAALGENLSGLPCTDRAYLLDRLLRPTPRLRLAEAAGRWCSGAMDLSDGLASDLEHLLAASGVAADIELERLPISAALGRSVPPRRATEYATSAGDDYELLLTCAPQHWPALLRAGHTDDCPLTRIGRIRARDERRSNPIHWVDAHGDEIPVRAGYEHFR